MRRSLDTFRFEVVHQEYTSIKIGGIELFLCTPQLNAFSTKFRKKLKELQIEYVESN